MASWLVPHSPSPSHLSPAFVAGLQAGRRRGSRGHSLASTRRRHRPHPAPSSQGEVHDGGIAVIRSMSSGTVLRIYLVTSQLNSRTGTLYYRYASAVAAAATDVAAAAAADAAAICCRTARWCALRMRMMLSMLTSTRRTQRARPARASFINHLLTSFARKIDTLARVA